MGSDKKQDSSRLKSKNGILIGKKANKTTPSPTWKLGFENPNFPMNNSVSARKIGANLWEIESQFNFNRNGDGSGGVRHRRRRQNSREKEGFELSDQLDEEPSGSQQQPPEIETSSRRKISELPSLRHLSVGKQSQDLHHVSSASYCSSMEVTPYVRSVTPTGYTVKTSTHLLKVLNRIWNLEEQHSSNMALIKELKRELDISRAQIKTLTEETKMGRQEMDKLKKSTNEQIKKAARSTKDEFIQEKKTRVLLESLCDEFAKGIRDYEQKVRFLQQKSEKKDRIVTKTEPDRLILHVSEAWLDERMQIKSDFSQKTLISDNLRFEIELFLQTKNKDKAVLEKRDENQPGGTTKPSSSQLVSRTLDRGPGVAEPSSQLVSRMVSQGPEATEPSSESMSRMADRGPGAAELSSKLMSKRVDRGPGAADPSSRRVREGVVKQNTLMAKLLEARLESQLSKSRTIRK